MAQPEAGFVPSTGQGNIPGKGMRAGWAAAEVLVARCDTDISCTFYLLDLRFKISWHCKIQLLLTAHHDNSGLAYPEPLTAGCSS